MGSGKTEAARRDRQGKGADGLDNVKTKGENFYRYALEDTGGLMEPQD